MLSLHLIAKNEEQLLPALLSYVAQHFNEIVVVVDAKSEDHTAKAAGLFTKLVFAHALDHDFSAMRNFGLSKATQRWIFQLDADEWPTPELLQWMQTFVVMYADDRSVRAVEVYRENLVGGQPIGQHTYEWHKRLFRRDLQFVGRIHEQLVVGERYVLRAPKTAMLLHHKSRERQTRQNGDYLAWAEQRALVGMR